MSAACPGPGRRHELLPFVVVGVACVVAGGLVAAATAPAPTEHGTWAAAYLVLVAGVAQVGLGLGRAVLMPGTSFRIIVVQLVGWNLGNAGVLAGTLLEGTLSGSTVLVDAGGALLVVTLALLSRGASGADARPVRGARRWSTYCYRLLVLLLVVSIPIGLALAHART